MHKPSWRSLSALVCIVLAALTFHVASASRMRAENARVGTRPAPAPPFQQPGHVHHPLGTIVGSGQPNLVRTDLAVRMMFRALGTA